MEWIINQLRDHPELAIFLTLFAGFWLGRFKIGKFSLGTVTSLPERVFSDAVFGLLIDVLY